MSASREDVLDRVRQWARYADEDLDLARQALTMGAKCPHRLVAYHAQQCAEKYLKAYLVHRCADFPFTHSISFLLELCRDFVTWPDSLGDADVLTRFAIKARYPGEETEVSGEKARMGVDLATRVRGVVRQGLTDEGVSL